MRYVIIRDDDTNALTPVHCLETLYRPFLDRNFPINLATIPNVRTDVRIPSGELEGFLYGAPALAGETLPIGSNTELVEYLKSNPQYRIVQHGCHHDYFEFDGRGPCRSGPAAVARRLEHGRTHLQQAGLGAPRTFVAPYDKLSRAALCEVAKRFEVLSTGWFELRRLPMAWWPKYLVKRTAQRPHWRVNGTALLTHPGCLLSCHRNYADMLDNIRNMIASQRLTVLVTHWWEYFRGGKPDSGFIKVLHDTVRFLESDPNVRVISFDDVIDSRIALN
jgi:hypothetical protein